MRTNEIKGALDGIKKIEDAIVRNHLKYKTSKKLCDFQKFLKIRSFSYSIVTGEITIDEADEKRSNLLNK